jgi:DnaJ-class molecular chaperone
MSKYKRRVFWVLVRTCDACEGEGQVEAYEMFHRCKSCDGRGWHRHESRKVRKASEREAKQ